MKIRLRYLCLPLVGCLLAGCSSTPKYQQAMALSIDDYQQKVVMKDSDKRLIFTSEPVLHNNPGTTDSDYNDNYFRAVIDKVSGRLSYQVVNTVAYQAPTWRFYEFAKFVTQEGINEQETQIIEQKVIDCSVFSPCSYAETISFEIDEDIVKSGAERYQPDNRAGIKYKLIARSGEHYSGIIFAQELIAVYNKIQQYRNNSDTP